MKMKTAIALTVAIGLVITTLNIPVGCSNPSNDPEPEEEYYFEDVNVLVIGRCRTIGSDGSWHGGVFIGKMALTGLDSLDTPLERLHVLVYNESYTNLFSRIKLGVVGMLNATGIFFWGSKGSGVSKIPPLAFVLCHAEKLWVNIY